ncbi:hypothetical protein TNCV_4946401 [Trichonephila clavipes]|nr:hypothetical protein TNCV_4946401 [Trichonephila clavipes]
MPRPAKPTECFAIRWKQKFLSLPVNLHTCNFDALPLHLGTCPNRRVSYGGEPPTRRHISRNVPPPTSYRKFLPRTPIFTTLRPRFVTTPPSCANSKVTPSQSFDRDPELYDGLLLAQVQHPLQVKLHPKNWKASPQKFPVSRCNSTTVSSSQPLLKGPPQPLLKHQKHLTLLLLFGTLPQPRTCCFFLVFATTSI